MVVIVFLWIIAGIILLLCIPIVFELRQYEQTELWIKILFFRIKIIPLKKPKKPKKLKKKIEKIVEKPKEKEKKPDIDIKQIISVAMELVPKLWKWVRWLIGKIRFYDVDIGIKIARGDAAETADSYGKTSAYVYGTINILKNMFSVNIRTIGIYPDFLGESDQYYIYLKVMIIPFTIVIAAVNMLVVSLVPIFKTITAKDKNNIKEEV